MSTKILTSLYLACAVCAVALAAACNASNNSSAVAPLPVSSGSLPSPSPSGMTTPTPTPTASGTATPTPTSIPSGSCLTNDPCTQPLVDAGGELLIPNVGTFSGTVGYASNNAPPGETITFTTSITNIFGVPNPHGGTPIFWTRATPSNTPGGNILFNKGNQVATLTSLTLLPSQTYALCAYIGSFPVPGGPLIAGKPSHGTLTYPSPLTAQALKGTGGRLPTGTGSGFPVNIDTVVTQGVPSSC